MSDLAGTHWSDAENDEIVSAYFEMLRMDLARTPYSKAETRRTIAQTTGRSEGSVEYKNQNISAVLMGMGKPWIEGYKPATQFQLSLVDAVWRWLARHPGWESRLHLLRPATGMADSPRLDASRLYVGPPPHRRNEPPAIDLDRMARIAQRLDTAERDLRNRALGEQGEELVYRRERYLLEHEGRSDLAARVRWIAKEDGDGAGYDILSYDLAGAERLIEVKTTNGWERAPFHITRNELAVAEENRATWLLFRLWNFAREPRAFELRPPLEDHAVLTPTTFLAALK